MLPVAPRFAISAPWRGANPMKLRAADGHLALHSVGSRSSRRYHQPENGTSEAGRCRVGHPGFVPFPAAVAPTIATTVPTRSAVTSRQFGGSTRGSCAGAARTPLQTTRDIFI